jgi:ADP-ribose pyrophosphatase
MKPWKRIEPTKVDTIGWLTVVTKTFEMPDGSVANFQTKGKEHGHCIATIALTNANKVVVARQFRPGPEVLLDELPGGGVDENEGFQVAAQRELLEETGYKPTEMHFLGDIRKDAYTNTTWHYFFASGCVKVGDQQLDDNEHVEVLEISIAQLFDNVKNARMTDTEAVFLAYEQLKELEKA